MAIHSHSMFVGQMSTHLTMVALMSCFEWTRQSVSAPALWLQVLMRRAADDGRRIGSSGRRSVVVVPSPSIWTNLLKKYGICRVDHVAHTLSPSNQPTFHRPQRGGRARIATGP